MIFKLEDRAFVVHGFGKNEQGNINKSELRAFRKLAETLLALSEEDLLMAVEQKALTEIQINEEADD